MSSNQRSDTRLRRAALVCCLASWAWLAFTLPTFSDAGVEVLLGFLFVCVSVALAAALLVIAGLALARRPVPARWSLAAGALAVGVTQICWATDWDFRCRLWLSDASLRRYAADTRERRGPVGRQEGGEAGLFTFLWVSTHSDGSVMFVTGYGFKNPHGFIYAEPDARVPADAHHVYGPWYKFGGG